MRETIPGMSGKSAFRGLHSVAQFDRGSEGSGGCPEQHSSVVRPKVFQGFFLESHLYFPWFIWCIVASLASYACKCNFYGISEMGLMLLGCADNLKLLKELA